MARRRLRSVGLLKTLPKRAGEEHGGIQAAIFNLPGKFLQRAKMD
jgi:hypothetical protein